MGRELDERRAAAAGLQGPVSIRAVSGRKSPGGRSYASAAGEYDDRLRRGRVFDRAQGERQGCDLAGRIGRGGEATRRWIHHHRDRRRSQADRARSETGRRGSGSVEAELRITSVAAARVIVVATERRHYN